MAPLVSPAADAISAMEVPWMPRRAKRRRQGATISSRVAALCCALRVAMDCVDTKRLVCVTSTTSAGKPDRGEPVGSAMRTIQGFALAALAVLATALPASAETLRYNWSMRGGL